MTATTESTRFHLRFAWFNVREQFSDIPASLAANALVPFFVWLLTRVWQRFNSAQANFTLSEVTIYIGLTELLFMTFVRTASISRASGDFSIALARPRSWLVTSFSGIVGRSLGSRAFMLVMLIAVFPLLGANANEIPPAIARFFLVLPVLALLQGLMALLFATAQVLWHQTDYLILPISKVFLVLGGVWGPIADFSEPWRTFLVSIPPSDLFFQPIYFCVKGEFFQMSATMWLVRILTLAAVLAVANVAFFRMAKTRHQSYGG